MGTENNKLKRAEDLYASIERDPLLNELAKIIDKCADDYGCEGCFLKRACIWFWDNVILKKSGRGPYNLTAQDFQEFYHIIRERRFRELKRKQPANTRY